MLVAGGGLLGFVYSKHRVAERVVAAEKRAVGRLRAFASRDAPVEVDDVEEDGYRLEVVAGGRLPHVYVARPERPGETGHRWFATPDGKRVYEFDTVVFAGPPDVLALRRWLARAPGERGDPPEGWKPFAGSP